MKRTITFKNGMYTTQVDIELKDGAFSASAYLCKGKEEIAGGQCFSTVLCEVPELRNNALFMEIVELWKTYHLNDLHSGTMKQEGYLELYSKWHGVDDLLSVDHYKEACAVLKSAGLFDDNGVKYGQTWVKWELPNDVVNRLTKILEGKYEAN